MRKDNVRQWFRDNVRQWFRDNVYASRDCDGTADEFTLMWWIMAVSCVVACVLGLLFT